MLVVPADTLIAEAFAALEECDGIEFHDFYHSQGMTSEHKAWLEGPGPQIVTKKLQQLANVGIYKGNGSGRDLVLKCLELPHCSDVWNNGTPELKVGINCPRPGTGISIELHPDALTLAAARLLPAVVEPGDHDVLQIIEKWITRLFCFCGCFSFDELDRPCNTSNIETVLEVLKMLPALFQGTKFQQAVKRKVKSCAATYMSFIEDLMKQSKGPIHSMIVETKQLHEWKLDTCYNAIMSLTDADHPSGKFNNPWWAERGFTFPTPGQEHSDEEWMDEYMYKRSR
eukprot:gnl/TRDRNA2_/TRDRNA2_177686_c4_seq1.p1 gnl/TRDRNA2_/TRDRNA2_177686_c4~~gnl/TRDRNA2_/TRDRNA2_177686_c4_seq1.p1  ORF type:complete len:285 (+),score=47.49 gnl/TRDRNA2_/TRDRNA2_177686_c4_seq1:84-938(+)